MYNPLFFGKNLYINFSRGDTMDKEKLKNIVVLKNLPSNLVDEAIVILKPNKKIRKLELIDKNKSTKINNKETKDNTHVINEAEMLVNSFISEIEKAETNSNSNDKLKKNTID